METVPWDVWLTLAALWAVIVGTLWVEVTRPWQPPPRPVRVPKAHTPPEPPSRHQ